MPTPKPNPPQIDLAEDWLEYAAQSHGQRPGTSHPRQLQQLPVELGRSEGGNQVTALIEGAEAGVGAEEGMGQLIAEQQDDGGGAVAAAPDTHPDNRFMQFPHNRGERVRNRVKTGRLVIR